MFNKLSDIAHRTWMPYALLLCVSSIPAHAQTWRTCSTGAWQGVEGHTIEAPSSEDKLRLLSKIDAMKTQLGWTSPLIERGITLHGLMKDPQQRQYPFVIFIRGEHHIRLEQSTPSGLLTTVIDHEHASVSYSGKARIKNTREVLPRIAYLPFLDGFMNSRANIIASTQYAAVGTDGNTVGALFDVPATPNIASASSQSKSPLMSASTAAWIEFTNDIAHPTRRIICTDDQHAISGMQSIEYDFHDYAAIDGLFYPTRVEEIIAGAQRYEITFTSVEVGTSLPDSAWSTQEVSK